MPTSVCALHSEQPAQLYAAALLTTVLLIRAIDTVLLPVTLGVALAHTEPVEAAVGVFGAGDGAHCSRRRTQGEGINLPPEPRLMVPPPSRPSWACPLIRTRAQPTPFLAHSVCRAVCVC